MRQDGTHLPPLQSQNLPPLKSHINTRGIITLTFSELRLCTRRTGCITASGQKCRSGRKKCCSGLGAILASSFQKRKLGLWVAKSVPEVTEQPRGRTRIQTPSRPSPAGAVMPGAGSLISGFEGAGFEGASKTQGSRSIIFQRGTSYNQKQVKQGHRAGSVAKRATLGVGSLNLSLGRELT